MDKEMIVKALRSDSSHISCNECSYYIRDNLQLYCDYSRLDCDAADLIEAQAAEIERLTAERDAAVESWHGFCATGSGAAPRWPGRAYDQHNHI